MELLLLHAMLQHHYQEKYMKIFFLKKPQTHNVKLCNVRKIFDQYNLISGLHTFMSSQDSIFKNILPPLGLLNNHDKNKLILDLKKLDFDLESTKAA